MEALAFCDWARIWSSLAVSVVVVWLFWMLMLMSFSHCSARGGALGYWSAGGQCGGGGWRGVEG
jgi:hypothetical protein